MAFKGKPKKPAVRPIGRPPTFDSPEQLEQLADAYFTECKGDEDQDVKPITPTVNGLCLALGCCRETIWDYAKKPEFAHAVKRVRSRLEMAWEQRLAGQNVVGAIFWLKNQGWTDKTELDVKASVSGSVRYEAHIPKRSGG